MDMTIPAGSKVELLITQTARGQGSARVKPEKIHIEDLKEPGIFLGMVN